MPPLFTATNAMSLVRQVVHAARHIHPSISTRSALPTSRLTKIQRAQVAFRHLLHETFPSLSAPVLQPARNTVPLHPGFKAFGGAPLGRATQAFRGPGFRLGTSHARGPTIVSQAGLGSARTFASTPAYTVTANAPIFLRAFATLDGDDLPKANRYIPYRRPTRSSRNRCGRTRRSSSSWLQHSLKDLEHFFPARLRSPPLVHLPLVPEKLVTPGHITTLAIALSPSLRDLLQPTTEISYREAELGMSIFTHLLHGIPAVLEAFSIHGSTKVYPLLNKLASFGVLDVDSTKSTSVRLEIVPDHEGRPDIMNIVFPERSERDVRKLLGETLLLKEGETEWFALLDTKVQPLVAPEAMSDVWANAKARPHPVLAMSLDEEEQSSGWEDAESKSTPNSTQLIYPVLDVPQIVSSPTLLPISAASDFDEDSWPCTANTSPFSSPSRPSSPWPATDTDSLERSQLDSHGMSISSLASRREDELSPAWSIPLSMADEDIESSVDLSDLGEAESILWSSDSEFGQSATLEGRQLPGMLETSWISDRGYGIARPW